MPSEWFHKIFSVQDAGFEALALEIFRFQYEQNSLYKAYADILKRSPDQVNELSQVPFLPIRFFKTHSVKTGQFEAEVIFESSGTTEDVRSRHFVKAIEMYKHSFLKLFERFYGPVESWCILALLPSYLERTNSSLVFMVDELIRSGGHPASGFYLNDYEKLFDCLKRLEADGKQTLLIGVSFALLDFADRYSLPLSKTIIMETGGMKGRGREMVRTELHQVLKERFHVKIIHSEYGMTELLSQAYSPGNGIFYCPPWMNIAVREEEDPLKVLMKKGGSEKGARGVINIIDLANVYSCAFIATDDAGQLYGNGSFEVLGRIDNSDLRGCSLMAM